MTPDQWRRDNEWKHGRPNRIVLSGERPDPYQLPETGGEAGAPTARRRVSLVADIALLLACAVLLAALYWWATQ